MSPDGDISLSRFDGCLKQHRPAALSPPQNDLMAIAFPGFLSNEETREQRTRFTVSGAAGPEAIFDSDHPGRQHYVTKKNPRRFGGDENFPSGRYHVVALDEHGHDKGTLLNELSAYARPPNTPTIIVHDLCESAVAARFGLPEQPALLVSFSPEEWHDGSVGRALEAAASMSGDWCVLEHDGASGRRRAIRVPYVVERTVIDNVVDLRLPKTQTWFARAFGVERRHVFTELPGRPEAAQRLTANMRADHAKIFPLPTRFVDMLPALLWHEIGGGSSVHQGVAAWMRHQSVAGLIFPSARTNCGVICRNGMVTDFRGWNFVDYRGASPPMNEGFIDVGSWPDSFGEGVHVHYATNAEHEGSWRLEGYEELQARQRDQVVTRSDGSIFGGADPAPAPKAAKARADLPLRKNAFKPTDTPVTSRPEQFQAGPDWFDFAPGGQCLDIRCPRCGWQNVWDRGDEEAPGRCPKCGFDAEEKRREQEALYDNLDRLVPPRGNRRVE
jgi:hypothetical protein